MGKVELKPKTLLYPVPVLMVSSGTADGRTNIMTAGWTGTICTVPPMAYVSIRPSRVSYQMIKESGEFVLNLTTTSLAEVTDRCGVTSARECPDKWEAFGLTRGKAAHLDYAPIIMESPLNIECKVTDIIALGSHDMFLGEVVGIDVSEEYVGDSGLITLDDADLIAARSVSSCSPELIAACSGANFHDNVFIIIFILGKQLDLKGLLNTFQIFSCGCQFFLGQLL